MKDIIRYWLWPGVFLIVGSVLGFIYYREVGCVTGTCPIASSPWKMTAYGAFVGFLIGLMFQPDRKKE